MAPPRLAPSTMASAVGSGIRPAAAKDITSSTIDRLECASQVTIAATINASAGSSASAPATTEKAEECLSGSAATQQAQRQQDQAQPDGDARDVAVAFGVGAEEGEDADGDQQRRDPADVEREDLCGNCRADIGAQHHRECHRQRDQPAAGEGRQQQRGGGRALQQAGDEQA